MMARPDDTDTVEMPMVLLLRRADAYTEAQIHMAKVIFVMLGRGNLYLA